MRGVVLDLDSLHPGDLDLSRLQAALPEWSMYGSTASSEVQSRIRDAQVVLSNKVVLDRAAFAAAGALRLHLCGAGPAVFLLVTEGAKVAELRRDFGTTGATVIEAHTLPRAASLKIERIEGTPA